MKRTKTSLLAHSYIQNLPKGTMYIAPNANKKTKSSSQPITPFKNKNKTNVFNLINVKTDRAKVTLCTNTNGKNKSNPKQPQQHSVSDIQNILNMNDTTNGYKVVTEKEFKLISDISAKEEKLLSLIKRNEVHISSSKQQINKIKRNLEQQSRKMIHSLQEQIEIIMQHVDQQMESAEGQIQCESKHIYKALNECVQMKQMFKDSVNEPVSSWNELKQRSNDNYNAAFKKMDKSFKSVQKLQIVNNINWQSMMIEFAANIKEKINIVVAFEQHSLDTESAMDGDIQINEIKQQSNGKRQAIKVREPISPISNDMSSHQAMNQDCALCPVPMQNENKKEQKKQQKTAEMSQDIDVGIIGFTRECDVHFLNMNVCIAEDIKIKDCVWNYAPNEEENGLTTDSDYSFYHVKYPSIALNECTNKIYRFGGVLNGVQLQSCAVYDPSRHEWNKLSSTQIARQDAVSLMVNKDQIIYVGGAAKVVPRNNNFVKEWKFYNDAAIYDINDDLWSNDGDIAGMNEARYGFCGLSMRESVSENKVIIFGGNGPNGRTKSVELYNVNENKWTYLADIPVVKARHGCCWYNDHVVVAGGDSKSFSKQCYLYSVHRGEWTELPSLNEQRDRPIVKSYEDKSCIVVFGDGLQVQSFEILDERMDRNEWILSDVQNHPLNIDFRAGMVAM